MLLTRSGLIIEHFSILAYYKIMLLFPLILISCSASPPELQNRSLIVKKAALQELYSGVRGGGKNIQYTFNIEVLTNKPLHFDSVWVADKRLAIRSHNRNSSSQLKTVKGETIILKAFEHVSGPAERIDEIGPQTPSISPVKAPVSFDGAALIRYTVNGKTKYLAIPAFEVEPPVYGQ